MSSLFRTSKKNLGIIFRLYSSSSTRKWTSGEVRSKFLEYFKSKDHLYVPSSSVIPKKDEGSYFINAGMNQFKPIFLGKVEKGSDMSSYQRVVNSQKCIRVGGKHNDLDDVGKDLYHHTFFEMLGSWSFGDYFKKEACCMAWELLTQVYQLPPSRLYVSYFGGNEELGVPADVECKEIWREIGVLADRILPFGECDNFWDMGETGPCGPCTEIHYDHLGRQDASHLVNAGSPEVVELWNLVFMQFDRQHDKSLLKLPRQHVDTGMGLERLCAVLSGTTSNYNTDLFMTLFQHIQQQSACRPYGGLVGPEDLGGLDTAYRVVADHARMITVALSDGVVPGRKDASFKLRHIIHRSVRQASDILQAPSHAVGSLVPVVVDTLGDVFPELEMNAKDVEETINYTEERYWLSVAMAKKIFKKALIKYNISTGGSLSGERTTEICEGRFGRDVPLDILCDIAEQHGVNVDVQSYEEILKHRQDKSTHITATLDSDTFVLPTKDWWPQSVPPTDVSAVYQYAAQDGIYTFESLDSQVVAIKVGKRLVSDVNEGTRAAILVDKTCFYAEKGGQWSKLTMPPTLPMSNKQGVTVAGVTVAADFDTHCWCKPCMVVAGQGFQVGDQGYLYGDNGSVFRVEDTQETEGYVLHIGVVEKGALSSNTVVTMSIDQERRESCMYNHTATHILQYCLSKVLGKVKQQGSSVAPHKLTFDFSLNKVSKKVSSKDLSEVTRLANDIIQHKQTVHHSEVEFRAVKSIPHICYLEDTVYPKDVGVISIGDPVDKVIHEAPTNDLRQSVELCGGTHVRNTGDIQILSIIGFQGGDYGFKSITAVTGAQAIEAISEGKLLRNKMDTLKQWVQQKQNKELWKPTVKEINKIWGEAILPKIDRDYVQQELDKIGKYMQKTMSIKEEMRSHLNDKVNQARQDGYLVCSIAKSKPRDVVSVIASLDSDLPMMVLYPNKDQRHILMGSCYIPTHMSSVVKSEEWASHTSGQSGKLVKPKDMYSGGRDMWNLKVEGNRLEFKHIIGKLENQAQTFIKSYLKKS